jgi:hypothetical protein
MKSKREQVIAGLPGSPREVAIKSGVSNSAASDHLNELHKQNKIHVTNWIREPRSDGRGKWTRVFALGEGIDAPCPAKAATIRPTLTSSERESRRAQKADQASRNKALQWADRAARGETVDPMVQYLFGRAA